MQTKVKLMQFKITYMNKNKEQLNERIKRLRKTLNLTQHQLAKAVGVSHVTIYQWEIGNSYPKSKYVSALAKALRVSVEELLSESNSAAELEPGPPITGQVPMISWIQAGSWLEMAEEAKDFTTFYATTAKVGPQAFALRVIGDSMTSYTGGKSIPEGSLVIVDPDIAAENGKVVVARLDDSNEATLKQLVIDGGKKYLKPFNINYPVKEINGNCTIIGVVKQVVQEF